jgi:hypothetical protein
LKSQPVPPMTLGNAAAAHVRLIVWCKACGHQVEPDTAEMAERSGAETTVPECRERLVCSRCGAAIARSTARTLSRARRGSWQLGGDNGVRNGWKAGIADEAFFRGEFRYFFMQPVNPLFNRET